MIPTTNKAYQLLHNGCIALSQVETNGIKVDVEYLNQAIESTTKKIERQEEKLKQDTIYKEWKKRFGGETNMESGTQLGKILFEVLEYKCKERTATGKPKTDEATLERLDIDFVKELLKCKKLKKAKGTYLKGILRETINGYLHPSFNLHLTQTYRSSSDSPNFQNIPIRDSKMSALIRPCFIPRSGQRHFVEVDYSGIEVHGACWYHQDPNMLSYIKDKTKDMHRDMAQACYMLSAKEMTPRDKEDAKRIKNIRYCGKNKFVFPQFYGDWYKSCAPNLWKAIDQMDLHRRNGMPLKVWLKKQGIHSLGSTDFKAVPKPGTFINHIKEVENHFWNKRFKVYNQWKKDWYEAYQKKGSFNTLSGFYIEGHYKRNEVINYPVQGTAFHCLLWSLIRLQKLLKKYRMKSLIIGQIHDSIVSDVPKNELREYLELATQVMTVDIKKHWKFIVTPIEIEADVAPVGKSWYEKTTYEI